jgi:hypothetical protein
MKKVVGSINQRYGSGDPDPHQNVTDPQHCFTVYHTVKVRTHGRDDTDPSSLPNYLASLFPFGS